MCSMSSEVVHYGAAEELASVEDVVGEAIVVEIVILLSASGT